MQKWLKQNFTIGMMLTFLGVYGIGSSIAAVLRSDVNTLKTDVNKLKEQVNTLPSDIASIKATLAATNEDVKFIKNYMVRQ